EVHESGAGLMYFFDREHGRQRREMVREKARAYLRQTTEKVDGTSRDMMSRARGLLVELRSKVSTADRRGPWAPEPSSEARRTLSPADRDRRAARGAAPR